jgi:hypothetical protein
MTVTNVMIMIILMKIVVVVVIIIIIIIIIIIMFMCLCCCFDFISVLAEVNNTNWSSRTLTISILNSIKFLERLRFAVIRSSIRVFLIPDFFRNRVPYFIDVLNEQTLPVQKQYNLINQILLTLNTIFITQA